MKKYFVSFDVRGKTTFANFQTIREFINEEWDEITGEHYCDEDNEHTSFTWLVGGEFNPNFDHSGGVGTVPCVESFCKEKKAHEVSKDVFESLEDWASEQCGELEKEYRASFNH